MMTGLLVLVVLPLVIIPLVARLVSTRLVPDPFLTLCATAYMGLLIISFIFDRAGPGNEFGPLAELWCFYPIGLGFWVAGLVVLWRAFSQGEPLGYFRTTLQCVNGILYIGPLVGMGWLLLFPPPVYGYDLIVDIRAPKSLQLDPLTRVSECSDTNRSTNTLGRMKSRTDGDFAVFSDSFGLHEDSGHILFVQPPKEPFQVFRLPISMTPKPGDWTQWQRPDYIDDAEVDWRLLEESKQHDRSTTLPADCFELRYKIEKHLLEK